MIVEQKMPLFQQIFDEMRSGFRQSRLKFLFKFTALGQLLYRDSMANAGNFYWTYINSWWWNRLWFRSRLPAAVQDQFNCIETGLSMLKKVGILNEDICHLINTQVNLNRFFAPLNYLWSAGILNQANFDVVVNHSKPKHLAEALSYLKKAKILTSDNLSIVVSLDSSVDIVDMIFNLERFGILNQENFVTVASHRLPLDMSKSLQVLARNQILTSENRAVVATHANPQELAGAFVRLHKVGILTPENRTVVADHVKPDDLASALVHLNAAGILTPENREIVASHDDENLTHFVNAIMNIRFAGILNQENFNALIAPNHAVLISERTHYNIWSSIPTHLLTQTNFERLLTAAEDANPMAALQIVLNQILGRQPRAALNQPQSTHTASVHRSVSASAVKLKSLYGQGLNLEDIIKDVSVFVNDLDDRPKHLAAKRCIARISSPNYSFNDSLSNVSTFELLVFAWLAIHDRSKCQASIEDARSLIIEGLYEIQRGYNLDDFGNDLGGEDRPICLAGTFNKLMEKLNGIHQDVEVSYITHAGASAKFPKLIHAHAIAYLQSIARPNNAAEYEQVNALLARLREGGNLKPIWDKIKEAVKAELWDEFKAAYGVTDRRFIEMIEYGYEAELPDLTEIEEILVSSPAYQENHELQVYSLWVNRQTSPQAQYNFDQQYGLSIKP